LAQGLEGPGPDQGDILGCLAVRRLFLGLQGFPEGILPRRIPELQPRPQIVKDHVAFPTQPLSQEVAKGEVIAVYPGVIIDLPVEDEEGRFPLL
jgi:hypothetical protein